MRSLTQISTGMSANEMVRRLILPPLREDRGGSFSDRRIIYMQIASIGIDLGKTTFHLVALGPAGQVLVRRKFSQKQLLYERRSKNRPQNAAERCFAAE